VVLDAGTADSLDVTSAEILDELVDTLRSAGIALWLADLRGPVLDRARRTGLLRTVGEDHVFRTVEEAIDSVQDQRPPVRV
jgi:sulfate permease, SulP family